MMCAGQYDERLQLMKKAKLFLGLAEAQCVEVINEVNPYWREFGKGQIVISEGEPNRQIGILQKGLLTGIKFQVEGESHINHILSEGETFGLEAAASNHGTAPLSFTAGKDTRILFFEYRRLIEASCLGREDLLTLMSNLSAILAGETIKQIYKTEVLSKHSLRGRILTYLHVMEVKTGSKTFDTRMNQQEMADYLCVNRSALSKELNQLRREGLLDFSKTQFRIR